MRGWKLDLQSFLEGVRGGECKVYFVIRANETWLVYCFLAFKLKLESRCCKQKQETPCVFKLRFFEILSKFTRGYSHRKKLSAWKTVKIQNNLKNLHHFPFFFHELPCHLTSTKVEHFLSGWKMMNIPLENWMFVSYLRL